MDVNLQTTNSSAVAVAPTPAPAPTPRTTPAPAPVREQAQAPSAPPVREPIAVSPREAVNVEGQEEAAPNTYGRVVLREEDITEQMIDRAFNDINRVLVGGAYRLSYRVHEATGRVMVNVYNQDNEIIREIPPESRLEIFARIVEFTGLLFDQSL